MDKNKKQKNKRETERDAILVSADVSGLATNDRQEKESFYICRYSTTEPGDLNKRAGSLGDIYDHVHGRIWLDIGPVVKMQNANFSGGHD